MPRPSPVRDAVRATLSTMEVHGATLDELRQRLAGRGVRADFSSVYRAVVALRDDGTVVQVDLGDGQARYEGRAEHHEHVRCEACGAIAAVPGCLLGPVRDAVEAATGYQVSAHSLVLSGRCPDCTAPRGGRVRSPERGRARGGVRRS